MAKFAHIALQAEDPSKTADFYKDALGLTELFRQPADTGAEGVWLSDGDIYFAIIKKGKSPEYVTGEGGMPVASVHHIGFHVDDLKEACESMDRAKATQIHSRGTMAVYRGPDDLVIDLRHTGWAERIKPAFEK